MGMPETFFGLHSLTKPYTNSPAERGAATHGPPRTARRTIAARANLRMLIMNTHMPGSLHMPGCFCLAGGLARPASTLRKRVENGTSFQRGMFNAGAGFDGIFDCRKPRSKMSGWGLGRTPKAPPQGQKHLQVDWWIDGFDHLAAK
jgi:hypothetical protein